MSCHANKARIGEFVLDDDSAAPVLLIAFGDGISPIRSLVEHAISIDLVESFTLYWLSGLESGNYLDRLCRSWNDSLDNFRYLPIGAGESPGQIVTRIAADSSGHHVEGVLEGDAVPASVSSELGDVGDDGLVEDGVAVPAGQSLP